MGWTKARREPLLLLFMSSVMKTMCLVLRLYQEV